MISKWLNGTATDAHAQYIEYTDTNPGSYPVKGKIHFCADATTKKKDVISTHGLIKDAQAAPYSYTFLMQDIHKAISSPTASNFRHALRLLQIRSNPTNPARRCALFSTY